mgnify:CR=1 FL=1
MKSALDRVNVRRMLLEVKRIVSDAAINIIFEQNAYPNTAHVALVSGNSFGNPECIRISYAATKKKLKIACDRIKNALKKLK